MIVMKSSEYVVIRIKGKTQAEMFKDVEVGDKLQFSIPLKHAGGSRGTHASYITAKNLTKNSLTKRSFNQLPGLLERFELEEVE